MFKIMCWTSTGIWSNTFFVFIGFTFIREIVFLLDFPVIYQLIYFEYKQEGTLNEVLLVWVNVKV